MPVYNRECDIFSAAFLPATECLSFFKYRTFKTVFVIEAYRIKRSLINTIKSQKTAKRDIELLMPCKFKLDNAKVLKHLKDKEKQEVMDGRSWTGDHLKCPLTTTRTLYD